MESASSVDEALVCQTCGDKGFTNAFIYCVTCLEYAIHRYCLDIIHEKSDELVIWFCEDCKPAGPYKRTVPKDVLLQPQKENPTNSTLLKTTFPKKKRQKKRKRPKRKIVPLVVRDDNVSCRDEDKPNRDHQSFTKDTVRKAPWMSDPRRYVVLALAKPKPESTQDSCHPLKKCVVQKSVKTTPCKKKPKKKKKKQQKKKNKSISERNQISPCVEEVVLKKPSSESVEMDMCFPLDVSETRKRDATCLGETTNNNNKSQKSLNSIQHSSCDSSCSNATVKDTEYVTHCVDDDQGFEVEHEDDELKMKKEDNDGRVGTLNDMPKEQNVSVDGDGVDGCKLVDIEVNLQCSPYEPARPVLEPVWRGSFEITQTDYELFEGFVGHLSSKACYMVCAEATTLPSMLSLQMQPKTDLWPKSFLDSQPSDENIALYFFPGNLKNERGFEQLVNDMIDEDLAMKATAKNAELLIFTSRVLPQSFWRFQGNYYLWGVFRRKRNDSPSQPMNVALNTSNNSGPSEISRKLIIDGK
ncbi:PHD finger-containing protein 1 [Rutidosis leptorrhynchoides]|uniref:PHD finger-containing protein 1 n=1 Tax=Rutidosis leptorrhynchoides TaxID=125765 RepID=UPI003A9A32E3